jgi:hypothetical protein
MPIESVDEEIFDRAVDLLEVFSRRRDAVTSLKLSIFVTEEGFKDSRGKSHGILYLSIGEKMGKMGIAKHDVSKRPLGEPLINEVT